VRRERAARKAVALLAALTVCTSLPGAASAGQTARLNATLTPERLGHNTTVGFGFVIQAAGNHVPPPLTSMKLSYPSGLGVALSELGLATCSAETLETFGPQSCPANSLMGYGTALAEIPVGPSILHESAQVTIVRTINQSGHIALLICASGETPVSAQIVFPGVLLPAPAPFGGRLDMTIPLVPSLPEAPDVAVVQLRATLGPQGLTYHEHIHGHVVNYQPRGIPLSTNCPREGFKFSATFSFQDGTHALTHTAVPCPTRHR
jgi:hypothetical protein